MGRHALQEELLWTLDEMQLLHGKLDYCDVPNIGIEGLDMTLLQRLDWLATRYVRGISERPKDAYGKPIPIESHQLHCSDISIFTPQPDFPGIEVWPDLFP